MRYLPITLIILLVLLAGCGPSEVERHAQDQKALIAAEAYKVSVERQMAREAAMEPVYRAGTAILYIGLPLVMLVMVGSASWVFIRRELIKQGRLYPDLNGAFPIEVAALPVETRMQIATIMAHGSMQTNMLRATYSQPVPSQLSVSYTGERNTRPALPTTPALPSLEAEEDEHDDLPEIVRLKDVYSLIKPGYLAMGIRPGGDIIQVPFNRFYMALFHGDTRSGKTTGINNIITQLHLMSERLPIELVAGDWKHELKSTWSRSRLFVKPISASPAEIVDILEWLIHGEDGIIARQKMFEREASERNTIIANLDHYRRAVGIPLMIRVAIIDEINALMQEAKWKGQIASLLTQGLQTGAGTGTFILGGAQHLTSDVLSREGNKQFVTRAHYGAMDESALRMMFGNQDWKQFARYIDGTQGRGIVRMVQEQYPTAFQTLYSNEDDILDVISRTNLSLPDTQPVQQITREEQPGTEITSRTTSPTIEPPNGFTQEDVELVMRLVGRDASQNIILQALGVAKGSGPRYINAKTLIARVKEAHHEPAA